MLPKTICVDLHFTFGIETLKVLSIPRDKFILYSFRPLKWLRFLGYAIYGAEGDIFEIDGLQYVDYDSVTDAAQLKDGYCFLSPRTLTISLVSFPALHAVKPHLVASHPIDERLSAVSSTTDRSEFEQKVQARDKGCVVTREVLSSECCETCHILPFAKKDSVSCFSTFISSSTSCRFSTSRLLLATAPRTTAT